MTSIDIRIKRAFEVEKMSPEDIAQDENLDPMAVKARLMQISNDYRKACGKEAVEDDTLNFNNDQLRDATKIIHEIALSAEHSDGSIDYKTRLQAAVYLRDDKKGRKEQVKAIAGQTFNILNINQMLQQARLRSQEAIASLTEGEAVNV